jgi:hypothetical protein
MNDLISIKKNQLSKKKLIFSKKKLILNKLHFVLKIYKKRFFKIKNKEAA